MFPWAALLLHVRSAFLFMKISQDIRDAAQARMQEKAREFKEEGARSTCRNPETLTIGATLGATR